MKILGIAGSPRRNGNTQLLLDQALEGAKTRGAEAEGIILNDLDFSPCQECGSCDDTGICAEDDDMGMIYEKFKEADAFVISAPIFFGCVSAQTKMMIDRFQCWWVAKYVPKQPKVSRDRKRKGLFISVGGRNRLDYFEDARRVIKILFANAEIAYSRELFYPGVDAKGEITNHPTAMQEALESGQSLVQG